jgi:Protein of unknown function (DUF2817)
MIGDQAFSTDYRTARDRFRSAAVARGFRLETHPVDGSEDLTVDVALGGDEHPARMVVVSGGLHGVEGFLGSAIQTSILEADPEAWPVPPGSGLVLMHALDPFGYAHLRRCDADNVDLNRNFLLDGDPYSGSPPTYRKLDRVLNPRRPPRRFDLLTIESIPALLLHGKAELKRAIAGGQYDFPKGLFFGGKGPSAVRRLLEGNMARWVGEADYVLHLDVHTGLGRWRNLALLLEDTVTRERALWLAERFGPDRVEWSSEGISYPTRGGLGAWCQATFADRVYDFLCAEFGTYSGSRVVAALRAENQAHHWGRPDDPSTHRAKSRLLEAFAPADADWRAVTVAQGLETVRLAFEICFRSAVVA